MAISIRCSNRWGAIYMCSVVGERFNNNNLQLQNTIPIHQQPQDSTQRLQARPVPRLHKASTYRSSTMCLFSQRVVYSCLCMEGGSLVTMCYNPNRQGYETCVNTDERQYLSTKCPRHQAADDAAARAAAAAKAKNHPKTKARQVYVLRGQRQWHGVALLRRCRLDRTATV